MVNTKRKTLTVTIKSGFEDKFILPIKPSSKEVLDGDLVKLTFNGSEAEINELFIELHGDMLMKVPSKREIVEMADETGIVYQENLKRKQNCGISMLQNKEESP